MTMAPERMPDELSLEQRLHLHGITFDPDGPGGMPSTNMWVEDDEPARKKIIASTREAIQQRRDMAAAVNHVILGGNGSLKYSFSNAAWKVMQSQSLDIATTQKIVDLCSLIDNATVCGGQHFFPTFSQRVALDMSDEIIGLIAGKVGGTREQAANVRAALKQFTDEIGIKETIAQAR